MSSHALASYHPAVQLGYFVPVLLCTMWIQHPVVLLMALVCALLTVLCLGRKNARKTVLCVAVPSAFLVAVLNPLDAEFHAEVERLAGCPCRFFLAEPHTTEDFLEKFFAENV